MPGRISNIAFRNNTLCQASGMWQLLPHT